MSAGHGAGELVPPVFEHGKRIEGECKIVLDGAAGDSPESAEHQIFHHRQLGKQSPSFRNQRHTEIDDRFGRELGEIVRLAVDR